MLADFDLFCGGFLLAKDYGQHLFNLFHEDKFHFFLCVFRHLYEVFLVSFGHDNGGNSRPFCGKHLFP